MKSFFRSFPVLLSFGLCLACPSAWAVKTAASFDLGWAYLPGMDVSATDINTGVELGKSPLKSTTGLELDYNIAIFDYRTVASFSFLQVFDSTLGQLPLTRVGIGLSYHLFRINGQRILLDNQVEGKVWGVSPALELSLGVSKLTINDATKKNFNFSASLIDVIPRLLVEVPLSANFLLMLRAGTLMTLKGTNVNYNIKLSGAIFNLGFKLTTL